CVRGPRSRKKRAKYSSKTAPRRAIVRGTASATASRSVACTSFRYTSQRSNSAASAARSSSASSWRAASAARSSTVSGGPSTSSASARSNAGCTERLRSFGFARTRSLEHGAHGAYFFQEHAELGHVVVAFEQHRQRPRAFERVFEQGEHGRR